MTFLFGKSNQFFSWLFTVLFTLWELFDLIVGVKSSDEVNSAFPALFLLKIASCFFFFFLLGGKNTASNIEIFVSSNSTMCCNFLVPAEALEVLVWYGQSTNGICRSPRLELN